MFPKNIKIVLSLICIALSIFQFFESEIGNGIALIILALMFIFLYFKNEIILISFLKLRKQDFDGTLKWLNRIKNPKSALTTKQYGYYNFLYLCGPSHKLENQDDNSFYLIVPGVSANIVNYSLKILYHAPNTKNIRSHFFVLPIMVDISMLNNLYLNHYHSSDALLF